MSIFSNILKLYPERSLSHMEHIHPDVTFPCPQCSGNGWHWKRDGMDTFKEACKFCKGSGRVRPEVTVHWVPTGEPNSTLKGKE